MLDTAGLQTGMQKWRQKSKDSEGRERRTEFWCVCGGHIGREKSKG